MSLNWFCQRRPSTYVNNHGKGIKTVKWNSLIATGFSNATQSEVCRAAYGWHLIADFLRHRVENIHQHQSKPLTHHLPTNISWYVNEYSDNFLTTYHTALPPAALTPLLPSALHHSPHDGNRFQQHWPHRPSATGTLTSSTHPSWQNSL